MEVLDLEIGEPHCMGFRQMWPGPREAVKEIVKLTEGFFNPPTSKEEAQHNQEINLKIEKIKNQWR